MSNQPNSLLPSETRLAFNEYDIVRILETALLTAPEPLALSELILVFISQEEMLRRILNHLRSNNSQAS